ncbi:MAG TPA: sodium:solute symporter family protein [Candidatus Thalassarchaeaceae archaeon]|nr:sodium:solute symporter family protein [Candidatus Thalassarchaeaceae archaeon]
MTPAWIIIMAYIAAMILFAVWARRDFNGDDESYYLASRGISGFVLLITMAATNFSAFTVYGSSGAAYRIGLSFLPIMAFGTGFMSVSMYLIGKRVRNLSLEHGAMTAPEIIKGQTGSRNAQLTMAAILIIATIPYLALQPRAAGIVVSALFGGPEWVGSVLVTLLVIGYTLSGGLKAVVRTDIAQGAIALLLLWLGLAMVIGHLGGLGTAMEEISASDSTSRLLEREENYTMLIWTSTMLLWIFADPMFPQLFQRLCAADSDLSIGRMATFYPIVAWLAFLPPILIGTMGHLEYPNLVDSDNILPNLVIDAGGEWIGGLVLVAGLAALMSTMDSQLLATGSLVTRDLMNREELPTVVSREVIITALALFGLGLSLWSELSILNLGLLAFSMYAVMFPSVFVAIRTGSLEGRAVISSVLIGEAVVMLAVFYPEAFDGWWIRPVGAAMPTVVIPALISSTIALFVSQFIFSDDSEILGVVFDRNSFPKPMIGLVIVFALAQDFWWWENGKIVALGMPIWVWWAALLSVAQTAILANWTAQDAR